MANTSESATKRVQLSKIRLEKQLHARLEQASRRNHVSLNGEIVGRLEWSFEQPTRLLIDQLAENVGRYLVPILERAEMLHLQAEVEHAAKKLANRVGALLATRVIAGREGEALRQDLDVLLAAIKVQTLTADAIQSGKDRRGDQS